MCQNIYYFDWIYTALTFIACYEERNKSKYDAENNKHYNHCDDTFNREYLVCAKILTNISFETKTLNNEKNKSLTNFRM